MLTCSTSILASPVHQTLFPALYTCSQRFVLSPRRIAGSPSTRYFQASRSVHEWNGDAANCWRTAFLVPKALDSGVDRFAEESVKKRGVVEHIFMVKAKADLSDDEEKDMLDFLYTSQYQMRGILAISLGRIAEPNVDGYTHAVYMRFQKKEDLVNFYSNSYYLGVLKDHVKPYCYDCISVDYESEVEDDILPIFRRGEEFNFGVEFVLLISILENALGDAVEDALFTLRQLTVEFNPIIVQATQGSNLNHTGSEYTHGAVIRFPSLEALEIFRGCTEFKDMLRWKFQPITKKVLAMHYSVDPVGTDLM